MHLKVSERSQLNSFLCLFNTLTVPAVLTKFIGFIHWMHSRQYFHLFIRFLQLILLSLVYMCRHVYMFYVPGVAPVEFVKGQPIMVKAVKMTSTHTQLPYEYYSLQFCLPKNGTVVYKTENLGEVLRGDRIVNTPYEVSMKKTIKFKSIPIVNFVNLFD